MRKTREQWQSEMDRNEGISGIIETAVITIGVCIFGSACIILLNACIIITKVGA